MGTYLGDYDERTDAAYRRAVALAIRLGINVIDTAINYRLQRSERAVGRALNDLFEAGDASRDELIICTKGGFIPYDMSPPDNPRQYIIETYLEPGIARREDFVGSHCMAPGYLQHELDQSLRNLRLDCLDVYYIHNPETQLQAVPREIFRERLRTAFAVLEAAVEAGKIQRYGIATWNGFRQSPSERDYLSLNEIVTLAAEACGPDHHFQVIQLPHNLAMPQAFALQNQQVGDEMMSTLAAAEKLRITVVASASLLQAQLADDLPALLRQTFNTFDTDAQRALQFVRSTPGVTTALVGMSQTRHVEENTRTAMQPPMSEAELSALFRRGA
jgi:aryl-alcohol dehydrogenase-like predicted oxidoreductase